MGTDAADLQNSLAEDCEGEKVTWTKRRQRQICGHWHLLKAQGQTTHSMASLSLECHEQDLCKFSLFSYSFRKHSVSAGLKQQQ